MNTTAAEARRLCKRVGQQFPTELNRPPKQKAGAVKHPDGTALEATFLTHWKRHCGAEMAAVVWKREFEFMPSRGFAFDFSIPSLMLAVEAEGRGHNKENRYHSDVEKYNFAAAMGWTLLRCTNENLRNDPAGFVALVVQAIERRRRQQAEQEKEVRA